MKRIRISVLAILLLPVLASGQTAKSRATLYTQIDASLPSNTTGAITAATLRTVFKDTIASAYNSTTDGAPAAAQVQTDWNAVSGLGVLLNKPTLFDGTWTSLSGKPTFAAIATSGSALDLTATGTKDATTFLRGDNTWAVPAGGGGAVTSVAGRTGAVTLTNADISGLGSAATTSASAYEAAGAATAAQNAAIAASLQRSSNLSDLFNATTARTNLGLGNVSNTSDANKPVSTAQAAADTAVQAAAIQRVNHTGTQTASTISDFAAAARAQTEAELIAGSGITITPASTGATRTLTIAATGGGGGGANLTTTAAPTTVTINSDSGTDATIVATDGTNAGLFLPAEKTKLTAITGTNTGDQTATTVASTPAGTLVATTVQAAINELDVDVNHYPLLPTWQWIREDFFGLNNGLSMGLIQVTSGGTVNGTANPASLSDDGIGWIRLNTGATATSPQRAAITSDTSQFTGGMFALRLIIRAKPTVQLMDGTNTGYIRLGFGDNVSAGEHTDGIYWRSVNGGNWIAVTRNNNVETATDTTIGASLDTIRRLDIYVNAAGTSAEFRIDDTLRATHTTNIPSSTARTFAVHNNIIRTAATAVAHEVAIDWIILGTKRVNAAGIIIP